MDGDERFDAALELPRHVKDTMKRRAGIGGLVGTIPTLPGYFDPETAIRPPLSELIIT